MNAVTTITADPFAEARAFAAGVLAGTTIASDAEKTMCQEAVDLDDWRDLHDHLAEEADWNEFLETFGASASDPDFDAWRAMNKPCAGEYRAEMAERRRDFRDALAGVR